jgi:hypothetical protein
MPGPPPPAAAADVSDSFFDRLPGSHDAASPPLPPPEANVGDTTSELLAAGQVGALGLRAKLGSTSSVN